MLVSLLLPGAASPEDDRSAAAGDPLPTVYLVAARQKPRIADSLRSARVRVADDVLDAPMLLRVTVGDEKGFRDCGTRNNVKYSLRVGGAEILGLAAVGWTGTCEPNVFDELSARLARALSTSTEGANR